MSEPLNLLIIGRVIHRLTGAGLPALQIQAMLHPEEEPTEEVGSTVSAADGSFQMEMDDGVVRPLLESGGGLSIRVSDSTTLLLATSPDAWKPSMAGVMLTLRVGDPKVGEVEEAQTPLISGTVRTADKLPLPEALVRLRLHTNLGLVVTDLAAAKTDSKGEFSLRYRLPTGAEDTPPLLRLVVELEEEEVAASSLLKAPPSTLRVEITVPGASAEAPKPITKFEAKVAPFLVDHNLAELTKVEVGVIASDAKVSPVLLQKAVDAQSLVAKFEAQSLTLARPILQALLHQGLPPDGLGLALSNSATIQSAWGKAVKDGDLSSGAAPEINTFLEKATAIGAEQAIGTSGAPTALRKVLPAGLSDAQRLVIAETWITNTRNRTTENIWPALATHSLFVDPADAELLALAEYSFQLGDLTDWNDPVISKLRGAVSDTPSLAGRTQEWWSTQLTDLHSVTSAETWLPPGLGSIGDRIEKYANDLRSKVDKALPKEQVKRYVADSTSVSEEVKDFFEGSTFADFDIRFDQVDGYLDDHEFGDTITNAARNEIKKIQKTAQVTQDHKVIELLEEAEVDSVADLAKMPVEEFEGRVLALAASPEVAVATNDARYARATEDLMESYVRLAGGSASGPMPMFDQVPVQVQTLFGSLGGCACEACLSALSPSAYLVELAAYLRDGFSVDAATGMWSSVWHKITQPVPGIPNPLERKRREDLLLTPLTCAATQTPQPHIDLVNELLERHVPLLGSWGPASVYRTIDLASVDPSLDPTNTSAVPPSLPLRPDATADEMTAYPLDTWYPALRVLARNDVRTSFAHPFDRPTAESRLYLSDVGSSLANLLLLPVAAAESRFPSELTSAEPIHTHFNAVERLGMTRAEASVLGDQVAPHSSSTGRDAWRFGPTEDGRFAEDLGTEGQPHILVKGLLQRLHITWDHLLRVIGSRFVRRFSALEEVPELPPGCDLTGVEIQPGDALPSGTFTDPLDFRAAFLEGLHRFLRLQHRLGWEPEVLDAALDLFLPQDPEATPVQGISNAAWWALAETQDLARALRLKPIELLALWSPVPSDPSTTAVFVLPLPGGSLWEQVFEQGPVRQESDAVFAQIRITGAIREAAVPRALTELEQRALARALGLRLPDLLALRPAADAPLVADRGQIWKLWARTRVARSMGLPIAEAIWWLGILAPPGGDADPTGESGWLRLQELLRMVAFARTARAPLADVAYLLVHDAPTRSRLHLSEVRANATLTSLRAALKLVLAETAPFRLEVAPESIAEAAWVPSLARFTTHEAATRVFEFLDAEEPLTSETDTREGFLREVLGRVLWDHEITALLAIAVDESAARRQFVAQRLVRLSSIPDLPVPSPQGARPKNEAPEGDASILARRVLDAAVSPSWTPTDIETFRAKVTAFLGRLNVIGALGALSTPDDETVCDVAFGEGFYDDLAAMIHDAQEDIDARFDTVVRMCLLRQHLLALPRLDLGGVVMQPTSVLAALHVNQAFTVPPSTTAVAGLSSFLTSSFWAVVEDLPASSFAERELRREYLLVALDGLRGQLESSQRDAVRRSLQGLAEEVWRTPLPTNVAELAARFAEGLQPADDTVLASVFGATDLTDLGVEAAENVETEWSVVPMSFADRRNRGYAWLLRSALLFRDRLRDFGLERQLTNVLAEGLNVSTARCGMLLGPEGLGVIDSVDAPTLARDYFLSPDFILATEPVPMPIVQQRLERLWKAARAAEMLRLTDDELARYNVGADLGLLELKKLPVSSGMSETDRTTAAWRLLDTWEALSFRTLIQAPDNNVFDLIEAIGQSDGADAFKRAFIAEITDWAHLQPPADSDELFALPYTTLSYVAVSRRVRRRMAIESAATALGVPPTMVLAWAVQFASNVTDSFTPRLAVTQGIRQSLRSRFGDAAWLTRSKPLIDQLREKQRDALADFHCQRQGFLDRNSLFGWLLIDTEMSCCMQTTRVLFATAAVQTAIQRSLMGLEEGAAPRPGYARRWEWMKQYRVWEANRKVFLYPENWLDPSLRRDKTFLFRSLEESLQQSQLSDADLSKAIGSYLTGLDRISRLDVRALTVDTPEGGEETLHLVARTMSLPHEYFYRRRIGGLRWTSWEPLDVQIAGTAHTLIVLNGVLHLFWTEISGDSDDTQSSMVAAERATTTQQPAEPGVSVRVGYTRRENGGWTPPRVSKDSQRIELSPNLVDTIDFRYSGERRGRNLIIRATPANSSSGHSVAITVFHSTHYFANIEQTRILSTRLRACFVLRDCTGEIERILRKPTVPALSGFTTTLGFPVNALSSSDSHYYLNDDQLETWDNEPIPVTLNTNILVGFVPVMTVPRLLLPEVQSSESSHYQFRLTVDQSHVATDFVGRLEQKTPVILHDGHRAFLIELSNCFPCNSADGTSGVSSAGSKLVDRLIQKDTVETEAGPSPSTVYSSDSDDLLILGNGSTNNVVAPKSDVSNVSGKTTSRPLPEDRLQISALSHAGVCSLLARLNRGTVKALFTLDTQFPVEMLPRDGGRFVPKSLNDIYSFQVPEDDAPSDDLDFSPGGPYGIYNWEVFFHAPFRIACMLNEDQQFERAQQWFHFIFDPNAVKMEVPEAFGSEELGGEGSLRRCWRFRPFFLAESGAAANDLQALVDPRNHEDSVRQARQRVAQQIAVWLENPFDPHAIAVFRERAFQISVVFRYIDNLLDWGDQLFQRGTRESINEATQLYVLASELLGQRPTTLRRDETPETQTLQEALDSSSSSKFLGGSGKGCCAPRFDASEVLAMLGRWSEFCVPPNEQLTSYWDRVADRLFKIRHCLDIEGVRRDLPLFEPPIDPEMLVRALAAGVDIGSALRDVAPSLPTFRFQVLLQRAVDFTGDVKYLSGQLLSAFEKRDAEALSRLRAGHERSMLEANVVIRELQIEESARQREALLDSRNMAARRERYYRDKPFMNAYEIAAMSAQTVAIGLQTAAQVMSTTAAAVSSFPDSIFGWSGGPTKLFKTGGSSFAAASSNAGQALSIAGSIASFLGSSFATLGGYDHRHDDWMFQANMALNEIVQIDKQIQAAQIRETIARHERDNLRRQITNAAEVEEELRSKFTNVELYDWMARQVSTILFQSYQMALDLARRAERAYRFERLDDSARFITADSWDSRQRGLLAGERLHLQLRRMEKAYLESERREYELTRHISLIQLNPVALLQLRENGECEFDLPETFFDRDHPGHYHRRIKSVSVSIPAVIGPYGGVHARLTLLSSVIRRRAELGDDSSEAGLSPEGRLIVRDIVPAQSIVTSSGQSDSGMFQLDFRSEKVLPFEGAGAVGRWRLEIDPQAQSFDTRTMTDVILHLQYTARDGGSVFAGRVREALLEAELESGRTYMVSLAQSAPDALHAFRTSADDERRVLVLPALGSLIGFLPRGVRAEFRTFHGFFAMRAPNAAVVPTVGVELFHDLESAEGGPVLDSALVDFQYGMRLAPGAAFAFETDGEISSLQNDPAPVLVLDGALGSDPLDALLDVILLLHVSLVREH